MVCILIACEKIALRLVCFDDASMLKWLIVTGGLSTQRLSYHNEEPFERELCARPVSSDQGRPGSGSRALAVEYISMGNCLPTSFHMESPLQTKGCTLARPIRQVRSIVRSRPSYSTVVDSLFRCEYACDNRYSLPPASQHILLHMLIRETTPVGDVGDWSDVG